ncbi:MAG TPA: PIN domain nuclease [Dehalococcoidia bacterium]|nr:PIN domain nuclease [Dehalococcoidia bacterium]
MSRVIVDTSAWIESFRPKGDTKLKEAVKRLIIEEEILLPGIIKAEILRGTKSKKEYERLSELLKGLIYLPVEENFWERLSRFSFDLLREGVTVPLTGAYIALLAIENKVSLLHYDMHFDLIAQKTRLEILKVD